MVEVGPDPKRLQDYVAGRLSEADRQELEERMTQDPALVQELEQLMRFREGLQMVARQAQGARRQIKRGRLRAWAPFLAAATLAGLALLVWQNHVGTPEAILTRSITRDSTGALLPVAAHFTFITTRGIAAPDLYPPATGLIELRTFPGTATPGTRFRITLTQTDDDPPRTVGSISGLAVAPDGYVHTYADASRLSLGSYSLHLEAPGAATNETFSFNLRSP